MPKRIAFQGTGIAFMKCCVVCLEPGDQEFKLQKTFTYGNRSITITLPVPLCKKHYDLAEHKNPREKMVAKVGMIAGVVLGLIIAVALLNMWANNGEGVNFLSVLMALIMALSTFLIMWVITSFWLAPKFGDPESKAARSAVKLHKYYPANQQLVLEFKNDEAAQMTMRLNEGSFETK